MITTIVFFAAGTEGFFEESVHGSQSFLYHIATQKITGRLRSY